MASAYFQIQLSVQPQNGGEAVLVPPAVLQDVQYTFVIVREGGTEAIVKLEGADAALKQIEKDKGCKKLTVKQLDSLRETYPKPKVKKKYREQPRPEAADATVTAGIAVDAEGQQIVETIQTIRSGFYLIDVPIVTEVPDSA